MEIWGLELWRSSEIVKIFSDVSRELDWVQNIWNNEQMANSKSVICIYFST